MTGLPIDYRHPVNGSLDTTYKGKGFESREEETYFVRTTAHVKALRQACEVNGNEKMLKASSTAFVARDMKSILEAVGDAKRGLEYWVCLKAF